MPSSHSCSPLQAVHINTSNTWAHQVHQWYLQSSYPRLLCCSTRSLYYRSSSNTNWLKPIFNMLRAAKFHGSRQYASFTPNSFAVRFPKCCGTGSNCVRTQWTLWQLSFYELNGRFIYAVDGLEREGHSRTSRLLKILRRPSRSEIGRSDNVLKTRWTFYERNCRTSDLLGTHYNVLQSGISYSTCARRPRAFLLRWSRSYTDPNRPYCDRNHFYSD